MAPPALAPPAPVAARRPRLRWLFLGGVTLALLPLGAEAYRVMFGSNFHTVVPGRVYRCSQPSAVVLDQLIAEQGIRSRGTWTKRGRRTGTTFLRKTSASPPGGCPRCRSCAG